MRHPGICGVARVCRGAVQVANLDGSTQRDIVDGWERERERANRITTYFANACRSCKSRRSWVIAARIGLNRFGFSAFVANCLCSRHLPVDAWGRVWDARNCCSRTMVGNCDSTLGCCHLQREEIEKHETQTSCQSNRPTLIGQNSRSASQPHFPLPIPHFPFPIQFKCIMIKWAAGAANGCWGSHVLDVLCRRRHGLLQITERNVCCRCPVQDHHLY